MCTSSDRRSQTHAYLRMLAGETPRGFFLDIRWMNSTAGRDPFVRRRFVRATELRRAGVLIERLANSHDVYVGVALRDNDRHGGKTAIPHGHLLHVDLDAAGARERLAGFHPASMLVSSGSTGHLHAYWHLAAPIDGEMVEPANRRLAAHLGADAACTDRARILRPPGTLNHKHQPPQPITLIEHAPALRYQLEQLTGTLPDPPPPRPGTRARPRAIATDPQARSAATGTALDRALRAVPAAEYVRALAGRDPDRAGKVCCPFHRDRTPSLQLYADNTWFCFGCRRGGSIYDFASCCWGIATTGREFTALRTRLLQRVQDADWPRARA